MNYYDNQQQQQQQQPVSTYQPPIPEGSNMAIPQQPSMAFKPSEPNSSSFVPDAKTMEILGRVHPELTNALINIAIKKFSTESDFVNYFIRDEFRKVVETENERVVPSTGDTGGKEPNQNESTSGTTVEFGSW